jgi:hypothetical protein
MWASRKMVGLMGASSKEVIELDGSGGGRTARQIWLRRGFEKMERVKSDLKDMFFTNKNGNNDATIREREGRTAQ